MMLTKKIFLIVTAALATLGIEAQQLFNDKIDVTAGSGVSNQNAVIYLPSNYSTSKTYPLVIFTHGMGEAGTDINKLYNTGLPRVLKDGYKPPVDFVMVAPQRGSYSVDPKWLDGIIEDADKRWSIDLDRVYITGLSAGGWTIYCSQLNFDLTLAQKFAGIVVLSGATQDANKNNLDRWKTTKIPLWAVVGYNDVSYREQNIEMVNEINKRVPGIASITVRQGVGHTGWNDVYKGTVKNAEGKNMWEWLFQFSRTGTVATPPANKAPVASAGSDKSITLPTNSITLSGSGSDEDGSIASYSWSKESGPSSFSIASANSAQTAISGLVAGTYTFQLKVTDNGGATATDNVTVTVNAADDQPVSGGSALHIEAESYSSMYGVRTENTSDAGGGKNVAYISNNDWMEYNVSVPAAGNYTLHFRTATPHTGKKLQILNSAGAILATVTLQKTSYYQDWATTTAIANLSAGNQKLRIKAVSDQWNFNWWKIEGAGTASNQTPSAAAGTDKTITLPINSVSLSGSGTDVDGTIASYSWSKVSGPSSFSFSSTSSAQTTVSNLVEGTYVFRLKVTDNAGATSTDDVQVIVKETTQSGGSSATTTRIEAESYTAMYGIRTENTSDAGGGKNVAYISANDWMDYNVSIPTAGNYTLHFRTATPHTGKKLQVLNSSGAILATVTLQKTSYYQDWATISVSANLPAGSQKIRIKAVNDQWNFNWWEIEGAGGGSSTPTNQAPTANAGSDISLTLPTSSTVLNGSGSDADGTVTGYSWTRISGPSQFSLSSNTIARPTLSGLVAGTYMFELRVTDDKGASSTDNVTVVVNQSAGTGGQFKSHIITANYGTQIYRPNGEGLENVKPGDTMYIMAGNYNLIDLGGFSGDASRPIIIKNKGGLVKANTIRLGNKKEAAYFKLVGDGAPGVTYGFRVDNTSNVGLTANWVHNIEIAYTEVSNAGTGIMVKINPVAGNSLTQYPSYTIRNVYIHNNYIHDIQGEGMYIGHTDAAGTVYSGGLLPIRLENVEISYNLVERTTWDGIQLGNASSGNKIHHNTVRDFGTINKPSQGTGITFGGNCSGDVYDNTVINGPSHGIGVGGYGTIRVYNNYIENVGGDGSSTGQHSIYCNDYTYFSNPKQQMQIYNNTIKNPQRIGAILVTNYQNNSLPALIQNNKLQILNAPADWVSKYIFSRVSGSTISGNTLL